MMALVDLVIGWLDIRMMGEKDKDKRLQILGVIFAIGLVVVLFDPF